MEEKGLEKRNGVRKKEAFEISLVYKLTMVFNGSFKPVRQKVRSCS